jgi:predicted ATPase
MSKFKLIAIRPLIGCDKKFLKNLTAGQIYSLYNNYKFHSFSKDTIASSSDGSVHYISNTEAPPEIYKIQTADGHDMEVNISAIAGKNGSGKSSLIELFFVSIFLYCSNNDILDHNIKSLERRSNKLKKQQLDQDKKHSKIIEHRNEIVNEIKTVERFNLKAFESFKTKINDLTRRENDLEEDTKNINSQLKTIISQQNEIKEISQKLKAEIFYEIDSQFYCLQINSGKNGEPKCAIISISNLQDSIVKPKKVSQSAKNFGDYFFYTIAINYSHYALNSLHIGDWIISLFHKNDGYKTPIVISPMRTDGNFNINSEIKFAKYRLLTNKLQEYTSGKNDRIYIAENHFIDKVIFTLNWRKVDLVPKRVRFRLNKMSGKARDLNMLNTFLALYLNKEELILFEDDFPLKQIVSNYLINKIDSIPEKYPWFGKGYHFSANTKHIENDKFFELLKNDRSHVTYKLKQTINFIKRSLTNIDSAFRISKVQLDRRSNIKFELTLQDLMEWMGNIKGRDIMEHLPPSLFDIDFKLTNGVGADYLFSALSSGEQQLVHTIQSVIYHLNNIQSAHLGKGDRFKYKNVNIIYDEIELYFHPDYQRRFIADLLKEFERFYIGGQKGIESINIILLTHSPFILSDIPSNNIMLLDSDKKKRTIPKIPDSQTFAANINELLADSFFLKGTLIGRHAENIIAESIENIKVKKTNPIDDEIFEMVGDSFLKVSLENFKKRQDDQNTNK